MNDRAGVVMKRLHLDEVKVREITKNDVPHWITMRQKLWPHASHDALKEAEHLLPQKHFSCFFAERGTELMGFIELALRPYANGCDTSPVAFVEGLWVSEVFQKSGIGRLLVTRAERWAHAHGVKELASDTRIESLHSIHAHRSWGFEETERVVYFRKKMFNVLDIESCS